MILLPKNAYDPPMDRPFYPEDLGEVGKAVANHYLSRAKWTWIYFVQAAHGPIKIGVSDDPEARLKNLQVAHAEELRLIGKHRAPAEVEKWLHEYLKEYRIRGEWYRAAPEVVELCEGLSLLAVTP